MISQNDRQSASISVICGRIPLLLAIVGQARFCANALAQQKIVKWEVEATVVEIIDPGGFFPDVRLGDPVRGWMSYDLGNERDPDLSEEHIGIYLNVTGFQGTSMVIENPRGGEDVRFVRDDRLLPMGGTLVNLANDYVDPEDGEVDWVWVDSSVLPPPGFLTNIFDIAVFLYGPANTLTDLSLPKQLNLDDWPLATVQFKDNFLDLDPNATGIYAEIHSLTPVAVTPGDYNSDGVVDSYDYDIWVRGFVTDWPGIRNGDGNGDGTVDAADYVVWRKALGNATSSNSHVEGVVPEPTSFAVAALAFAALVLRWRPSERPKIVAEFGRAFC